MPVVRHKMPRKRRRATPEQLEAAANRRRAIATPIPRSPEDICAALGPTKSLSTELHFALVKQASVFPPMPTPDEDAWLSQPHGRLDRLGQTWDEYRTEDLPFIFGQRERREARPHTLTIIPFGASLDPNLQRMYQTVIGAFYGEGSLVVKVASNKVEVPSEIRSRINEHTKQKQLNTEDIWRYAKTRHEHTKDRHFILIVTSLDLYSERYNFLYGSGWRQEGVSICSTARMLKTSSDPLVRRRILKPMLAVIGHMFGLGHCVYFSCLMNGYEHDEEMDIVPLHLCPVCLRKLHTFSRFSFAGRYAALSIAFAVSNLTAEARWNHDRAYESYERNLQPEAKRIKIQDELLL